MSKRPEQFAGTVIITWPQPRGGAMHGWAVSITDPATGQPINTVTSMDVHLHADAQDIIWAGCRMFADGEGQPILDGEPQMVAGEDGTEEVRYGMFPFIVQEMRVAP